MNSDIFYEGGCLCGEVRYRAQSSPTDVIHCHCKMCQRQSGALFTTHAEFDASRFTRLQGEPSWYKSSKIAERSFCACCGSSIAVRYFEHPDVIYVALGTLDNATELTPEYHIMTETQIPWLKMDDGLPRYSRFRDGDF